MLTVVTHTRNDRPALLKRAVASIEASLVSGVSHRIIECHNDWGKARYAATQLDEYVVFVDDDDTVPEGAIATCLEAAKASRAGLVVTDERLVDLAGNELRISRGPKMYSGIQVHPTVMHHLALIKAEAVDLVGLKVHERFGVGADWLIKASAALRGDALYVPIVGYNWTQHDDTMNKREKSQFCSAMYHIGQEIRTRWPRLDLGRVPVWDL